MPFRYQRLLNISLLAVLRVYAKALGEPLAENTKQAGGAAQLEGTHYGFVASTLLKYLRNSMVNTFAEILNNLVAELSFEELLQCFPSEAIQNRNTAQYFATEFAETCILYENEELVFKNPDLKEGHRDHMPMDNIDEDNVFELTLRKAVAKQRSIALRSMIESTGTQLFDATSNPMYNL